jgi:hypothetical protein
VRSKIIEEVHPTELYSINTFGKLLTLHKNILRVIEKKGCIAKNECFLLLLKWSKESNEWVLDRGTNLDRDIVGIKEEELEHYLKCNLKMLVGAKKLIFEVNNNKKFNELCNTIGVFKNNTKFLAFEFEVESECLYPIGLFQFCQHKKRKGLYTNTKKRSVNIDISESFIDTVVNTSSKFKNKDRVYLGKNYKTVYREYILYLKSLSKEDFYANNNIDYEDHFQKSQIIKNTLTLKEYVNYRKNISTLSKQSISEFLFIDMNISFGIYLKRYLNKASVQRLVIHDVMSDNFIKMVGDYYLINRDILYTSANNHVLSEPLMPMRF